MKEQENSEAIIQFELYRLIKNNLSASNSATVKYSNIEPEKSVKAGSVDLLVEAKTDNRIIPFLAIEVKKPSGRSFRLYKEISVKQIERYARELKSPYSALVDGEVLRLFNYDQTNQDFTNLGDYLVQLFDDQIKCFLLALLRLHENKQTMLSLPKAPPFSAEKLERELSGITKMLTETFDQLGTSEGFRLVSKPNERTIGKFLSFSSFNSVLRLRVEREKRKLSEDTSFIYLELSELRDKLGTGPLKVLLTKLKKIPCFEWIKPENAEKDVGFTWKNLRDINLIEKVSTEDLKKKLTEWFLELSGNANIK